MRLHGCVFPHFSDQAAKSLALAEQKELVYGAQPVRRGTMRGHGPLTGPFIDVNARSVRLL